MRRRGIFNSQTEYTLNREMLFTCLATGPAFSCRILHFISERIYINKYSISSILNSVSSYLNFNVTLQ